MITNSYRASKLKWHTLTCSVALAFVSPSLQADELEFHPYVEAAFTYDDNVYLLADHEDATQIIGHNERSDTIIDFVAGARGRYQSRRQNVKFGARVFRQDHNDFSVLDFTGATANIKGEWELSKRWTTNAGYRYERNQSSFSEENLAQGDVFDMHRAEGGLALHIGENKDLYVNAAFRDKDYEQRAALANERTDISFGYRQFSRRDSWLALELTHAEGDYPNRLSFANDIASLQDYTEDSVKLLSRWQLSDKTRLDANIGYVDRQHNESLSNFDYSGLVFDVDLEWAIGSKTQFIAQLTQRLRDTENTKTLFNKEQRLTIGLEWATSERLMFKSAVTLLDLEFIQQGQNRKDTGGIFEIGAEYNLSKRSSLEPKVRMRTRSSNNIDNEYDNGIATIIYRYML